MSLPALYSAVICGVTGCEKCQLHKAQAQLMGVLALNFALYFCKRFVFFYLRSVIHVFWKTCHWNIVATLTQHFSLVADRERERAVRAALLLFSKCSNKIRPLSVQWGPCLLVSKYRTILYFARLGLPHLSLQPCDRRYIDIYIDRFETHFHDMGQLSYTLCTDLAQWIKCWLRCTPIIAIWAQ